MKRAVELHCHNEVTETGIKASSEDLSGYSSVLLLFHFAGFSNVEAKDFFFFITKKALQCWKPLKLHNTLLHAAVHTHGRYCFLSIEVLLASHITI